MRACKFSCVTNKMRVKLFYSGFKTCFALSTWECRDAKKHISNRVFYDCFFFGGRHFENRGRDVIMCDLHPPYFLAASLACNCDLNPSKICK